MLLEEETSIARAKGEYKVLLYLYSMLLEEGMRIANAGAKTMLQ